MRSSDLAKARMSHATRVGFAIRSKIASYLPSLPKGISDRIMVLTLELERNISATLVSCYAPTMACSEQEKDDFYN